MIAPTIERRTQVRTQTTLRDATSGGFFIQLLPLETQLDYPGGTFETFFERTPCLFQTETMDVTGCCIGVCVSQDGLNVR